MKNRGSTFEHEQERNDDLMRAYTEQIACCSEIHLPQIFKRVVNTPSKRFWVSAERAAIVISNMIKGDQLSGMNPTKREMFQEIYRRIQILRGQNPSTSIYDLAIRVVQEPAPKFYITPGSARVIIYRIKKQWFEKRRQRPYHLRFRQ